MSNNQKNSEYKIAPSILSADFSNLKWEVERLQKSLADYIHIDVMDGHFVPNHTIGPTVIKSIRKYTQKVFDVHLMINNPEKYLESYIQVGADIIGIHIEIKADKINLLKKIRQANKKSCLVFNPNTSLEKIEMYFPYLDQITLMGVMPGFSGQTLMPQIFERGREVVKKIRASEYDIDLEIDGGVSFDNLNLFKQIGFNVIVSGSTLYREKNFYRAIKRLKSV